MKGLGSPTISLFDILEDLPKEAQLTDDLPDRLVGTFGCFAINCSTHSKLSLPQIEAPP
jgi:hypothetical protein